MEKEYEVYLAGRIANLSYAEANGIREEIIDKLADVGIKCRTPMRGRQYIATKGGITQKSFKNGLTIQEVIQRDLSDLREVDAIVVLTGDDASWGTAGEFYYSTWIAQIPTLVIAKNSIGGWMEYYATRIVPDVDSAVEVLENWKMYWNKKGNGVNEVK